MSIIQQLTDSISAQISTLAPITLSVPTTPIFQLSKFIHHITNTPVHPVYFPYLRFGVIHAVRVTTVWAGLTKAKRGGGRLQDLFGYLVLAWGGSTVVSLLLNQPPSWLISFTPWIIYISIYTLLIPTGLSRYFIETCPKILFNVVGGLIDGMTRGTTITSLITLISNSSLLKIASEQNQNSSNGEIGIWTYMILSGIAISSGGVIVGLLGINENEWKLITPNLLKGGILNTLDFSSSSLIGLLWLILLNQNQSLESISKSLSNTLPQELKISSKDKDELSIIDIPHARAICVLVLGFILAIKGIILTFIANGIKTKLVNKIDKKTELYILDEKKSATRTEVIKTPIKIKQNSNSSGSSSVKSTPRKSPRAKSK
ncbi:uncharacterized protein L201_001854 [Kwoniella dendrophila CBS 6074]|uniref:Transmembrane protein n=1 Tax=Kwoniella dendrophila CBS 6074 TaxID=1295534 RepID=A0AAX4JQ19_9TREE